MNNEINSMQNYDSSINMIAAFRQKYSDVKQLSFIQMLMSVWMPIVLALFALALKSQLIVGFLGIPQLDVTIYVSFYCIVIALADLFLFNSFIETGKELAAKIQELFDTNVLGLPWNITLAGPKPDGEVIYNLKNTFYKVKCNKREHLINWYNPKVANVSHNKAVLLCQRMNLYWDKSLRETVNQRVFISLLCWCVFIMIIALNHDLSLRTLLLTVICPLLPILSYSIKLISDNRKSISTMTRLKELLESAWADAANQELTIEKLREVQNEIYQHRKTNRPISDRFYWKRKDDFEGDAEYSIEQMITDIERQP
ncbi:S-4TM family putative pore-forming effector [Paraglaciecola aquimarina]|uniref:S-4TM family putative pore-forming effector n=1 Tax=Paraglaciecola algarum TaxID=3050085 RepID=A0ABS9D8U3_9ALTE|nr:S-4TM family putative pore-forming effector [Paraglaciecola sp. G1-23]MCF2948795.1 S-4TM family putative pore-forming effector [Paraglaciecola sp. G1-23]